MADFLSNYVGTIGVLFLTMTIVVCVIIKIIKDRKKGKSCGCDCGSCPYAGNCHEQPNDTEDSK